MAIGMVAMMAIHLGHVLKKSKTIWLAQAKSNNISKIFKMFLSQPFCPGVLLFLEQEK